MDEGGWLSERVVSKVADHEGVSEVELPPLYDSIEPDALEDLFYHAQMKTGAELKVQFSYAGCTVVIRDPDDIRLENSHVLRSESDT